MWRSLYEGAYTWSKTSVKEKEGLSAEGGGGGELIGREIQYAVQFHFNKYNFQIQWIILQLQKSQLKNKQALSDSWHWPAITGIQNVTLTKVKT